MKKQNKNLKRVLARTAAKVISSEETKNIRGSMAPALCLSIGGIFTCFECTELDGVHDDCNHAPVRDN